MPVFLQSSSIVILLSRRFCSIVSVTLRVKSESYLLILTLYRFSVLSQHTYRIRLQKRTGYGTM